MKKQKYITMTIEEYEEINENANFLKNIDYITECCHTNDDLKSDSNSTSLTYVFREENVKSFLIKYINNFKIHNSDEATEIMFISEKSDRYE